MPILILCIGLGRLGNRLTTFQFDARNVLSRFSFCLTPYRPPSLSISAMLGQVILGLSGSMAIPVNWQKLKRRLDSMQARDGSWNCVNGDERPLRAAALLARLTKRATANNDREHNQCKRENVGLSSQFVAG
jgi:hypothetical protein